MTTLTSEGQTADSAAVRTAAKPKKRAQPAKRARHTAPTQKKSPRSATMTKKGAGDAKKAPGGARQGSKTATILEALKRPGGVTTKEIMKTTGWQPHSVRGFLSGTVGKKMGLAVIATKGDDGERSYSVKP